MTALSKESILQRLNAPRDEDRLVVTPILDHKAQIGPSSIDLRLGSRFLVDLRTREAYISVSKKARPISTFFDDTYRPFGGSFILYPGQLALACTFEYLRIPYDLVGVIVARSSFTRLGITFHCIVQPGYAGTLTLELTNSTSNPVAVMPGMRIAQLQLHLLDGNVATGYGDNATSKYIENTGPMVSGVAGDIELKRLEQLGSRKGHRLLGRKKTKDPLR